MILIACFRWYYFKIYEAINQTLSEILETPHLFSSLSRFSVKNDNIVTRTTFYKWDLVIKKMTIYWIKFYKDVSGGDIKRPKKTTKCRINVTMKKICAIFIFCFRFRLYFEQVWLICALKYGDFKMTDIFWHQETKTTISFHQKFN